MKFNFSKKIILFLFLMALQFSFAQKKKEENIGSEVVNVVKPYTPTISDASKIQESPVLDDEGNAKKETIKYSIFSFPVASTFTPAKGKAEGVDKEAKEKFFNNYATLAIGNYGTLNAELFVNQELANNDYVGGMFRHFSSQGGINNLELDDWFYDTALDVTYGANYDKMSWNIDLGYQNQAYNWYGLPMDFGSALTPGDRNNLIAGIDSKHSYNGISLGGKLNFTEGAFKDASMKFSHFSDSFGSSENRFYVKPALQFDVADQLVKTDIIVDYVGGSFDKNYEDTNTAKVKYGFTNLGISPSFNINENGWNVKLGASLFYSIDKMGADNKFLIYPNVSVSYPVVEDLMIFYAGAEGSLEQNSYMDFVKENQFLSPTLAIVPTDKQYQISAGLKGKLASSVSYNIQGSYNNERNKALFRSHDYTENNANEDYAYGNSFQVVYDDVRTFRFSGNLKADFSENVSFALGGTFSSYKNSVEQEAWNLPAVEVNSSIDFNITPKWYAGAKLFYVGERKDFQLNTDIVYVTQPEPMTLKSYVDLNSHVGYKYNSQLTAFLKLNNMTNKSYQKWMNYPVQGFQVMIGGNYKFDF
ncbi:TonB-dependent receptor [Flavobacterium sufflavum]|uniref:TonB-dependent receptor n=1 Tax=Flavobacterium sufflavum TaxID=1921138 RepID=A0A437KYB5_9FLAO|nr:TonB-dependent receptor [Flavobacterium sufflavum]RVT77590.1 TonB-dependent receptor [Flavobacterium sufflavum]